MDDPEGNNGSHAKFRHEVRDRIREIRTDQRLRWATKQFNQISNELKYSYNFEWLGRPIIQYPQDIVAAQELISDIKPDLIIETGIARGGSLIFYASMLSLLDLSDAIEQNTTLDPNNSARMVLGIDVDLHSDNRSAIESHPMFSRIRIIEGSSIETATIKEVQKFSINYNRIMVCLDSNHTHEHVLAELEAYAPLTSVGSYCVVFDTIIEDLSGKTYPDRPWGPGNSPKTAVLEYLKAHPEFEINTRIEDKLLITVAPGGYLQRIQK